MCCFGDGVFRSDPDILVRIQSFRPVSNFCFNIKVVYSRGDEGYRIVLDLIRFEINMLDWFDFQISEFREEIQYSLSISE